MKRFLTGFLIALTLGVPATLIAAPPKTVNIVTPMKQDLDANGYAITNVGFLSGPGNFDSGGYVLGTRLVARDGTLILEPAGVSILYVTGGAADPSIAPGVFANPGSLYLRSNGTLYTKTGTADTDWTAHP